MKRIFILLMAASTLVISCKGKDSKKEIVAGEKTANDTTRKEENHTAGTGGYDITAPEGWEKIDTTMEGQRIIFVRLPRQDANDEFMENVNVVTEKVGGVSLDEYYNANVGSMDGLSDFEKGDVSDIKIDGKDFRRLEYKHVYGGVPLDATVYFTIYDGRAYVITCTAKRGEREKYRGVFDTIVNSFRVS
jgi:hypothetical protein